MQTIGKPVAAPERSSRAVLGSILGHGLLFLAIGAVMHQKARWVAPYRLPGSAQGTNFVATYLPGRAPAPTPAASTATPPKITQPKALLPAKVIQRKQVAATPDTHSQPSPNPNSTTGSDALGSGNISIALTTYFPPPKPDLSHLAHGTKGDVVLDVVIDTDGHISNVTMMSGLGPGIDEVVISTVQQWTFHPATQNGHPVASEQELHFHYERS